jgi:hypothetical protein
MMYVLLFGKRRQMVVKEEEEMLALVSYVLPPFLSQNAYANIRASINIPQFSSPSFQLQHSHPTLRRDVSGSGSASSH